MNPNSIETYEHNVKPSLTKRQNDVLCALIELGKATTYKIAAHLKVMPNTISGRPAELETQGMIESTEKETLPGSNRRANVWKPTQVGLKTFWSKTTELK